MRDCLPAWMWLGCAVLMLSSCAVEEYDPLVPEELYSIFETDSGVELIQIDSTSASSSQVWIYFTPRYDLFDEARFSRIIVFKDAQQTFFLQTDRVSVVDIDVESNTEYTYAFAFEVNSGGPRTKNTTPITITTP